MRFQDMAQCPTAYQLGSAAIRLHSAVHENILILLTSRRFSGVQAFEILNFG